MTALGLDIGNAAALALEAADVCVMATDMDVQALEIPDSDGVAATVAGRAASRVLINCAGIVHSGTLPELPPGDLKAALMASGRSDRRSTRQKTGETCK